MSDPEPNLTNSPQTPPTDPAAQDRLDTEQYNRMCDAMREEGFPREIGAYRILGIIGRGGMGIVYHAEQQRPRREVALKVIRPGLATAHMLRRFEYETDVLARLDHPGIARIFEAGIAETGLGPQPYFAMEIVQGGRSLDDYVRDVNLPITQRLQLLIEICHAVHHAHTKGVIHRDLKPGNILVTPDGKPKILDFGVARAIDSDIQATTMATESGQLIGTLPYMAPEQAAGRVNDLDTSSDVYALGVISYELLSGTMPYKLEGKALHEAVRVICEEEPSRLSSINRSLKGDVETIVQKALEKDKSRRYHTAGELAADVKHYLDYEPITARAPSTWYQLAKFTRRNKLLVGGVALLIFVLAGGAVTSTWFAIHATRQEREAKSQADIATAVGNFLTKRVLAGARPESIPDKNVRETIVRAMLDPAAAAVADDFKDKPLTEAVVRNTLAVSYSAIGRTDLALPHTEVALALHRRELGEDHPKTLALINNMGFQLQALGKLEAAEPLFREALERKRRVLGDDHPETLISIINMAALLHAQGKLEAAEPLAREALERYRRVLGDDHPTTLTAINNMGALLQVQGKLADAEPLYREALERSRRLHGNDHPDTLLSINNMGALLFAQGKREAAEPLFREVLERTSRVLGDNHPNTLEAMNNMGFLLQAQGKLADAEPLWREGLERSRRVLGDDHPSTLISIINMGGLLEKQGKPQAAEPLYREAVTRAKANPNLGLKHSYSKRFAKDYAECLDALGRPDEAAAVRTEFGLPDPSTKPSPPPATAPASRPAA